MASLSDDENLNYNANSQPKTDSNTSFLKKFHSNSINYEVSLFFFGKLRNY